MNSQEFVSAVERYVGEAAVNDTIANLKAPPGRRIVPAVKARSDWYNSLSQQDRNHVDSTIATAVHAALFGFLASLDGARTLDAENGRFELTYVTDQRVLLNPPSIDLHDLLTASQ